MKPVTTGNLKKLGLTDLESKVYLVLLSKDFATAKEKAKAVDVLVESVIRILKALVKKGFVSSFGKYPSKYKTVPIDVVVTQYVIKNMDLLNIVEGYTDRKVPIEIITNREKYHEVGNKYLDRTKDEVLIIASGLGNLSPDFFKSHIEKILQGVDIKLLVLTRNEINEELLENFKKNKLRVRYRAGEGINIVIYDKKIAQIGVRAMLPFTEKWGILINNTTLSGFLSEFFDFLWNSSTVV